MNVYKEIKQDICIVLIIIFLLTVGFDFFKVGWDETDGESRSGMSLRTDHQTGCQYLESTRGHLIPRVDTLGKHICGN